MELTTALPSAACWTSCSCGVLIGLVTRATAGRVGADWTLEQAPAKDVLLAACAGSGVIRRRLLVFCSLSCRGCSGQVFEMALWLPPQLQHVALDLLLQVLLR